MVRLGAYNVSTWTPRPVGVGVIIDRPRSLPRNHDAARKNIHASAFTLSRPLYEAVVKGLWLSYCAPEHKLEAFATGRELDSVSAMIEDLLTGQLPSVVLDSVRNIKQRYWKVLCSFAHAGHAPLRHWLRPDGVEPPHYTETEIKELMNFTAFMILVATLEMASLSNNGSAVVALEELLLGVGAD